MTFRPRRQPLAQVSRDRVPYATEAPSRLARGVRPSSLDGRLTTSTGLRSIDNLLAGHTGLPMGNALLLEENGSSEFCDIVLKYYAAEGVVQGHQVHVLGMQEFWARELPGLSTGEKPLRKPPCDQGPSDRMKIAWRYERLGEFGAEDRDRQMSQASSESPFCHDFDLSKRLAISSPSNIKFVPINLSLKFEEPSTPTSPLLPFINHLLSQLDASQPNTIHRVVIPNLGSPVYYPWDVCKPQFILQFFHSLRALLRRYPTQLTAITSTTLTLRPRDTGLTRLMELLSDGVLELIPLPPTPDSTNSQSTSAKTKEDSPQGVLKIHKLPVFHERGGGCGEMSGYGNDLAFTLSRRKGLVIKPFSLPPVEGNNDQEGSMEPNHENSHKSNLEF